jgi:BMFP domain-containing protein YqiC
VVQSALSKMDLVTREDFDVQVALLQKTTLRLKAVEERIAALELLSQEQ